MNRKKIKEKKALCIAIAMLCMNLLFFDSCKDEDKGGTVHDPSRPVVLTSFTPDSGRISEMVILEGENFGTDTSKIRVYFNQKKAYVLGSTGSRILVLTPRLPGDTCVLTVKVGDKEAAYPDFFRYKIMATASTLAGNGSTEFKEGTLDNCQLRPSYMSIDHEDNILVSVDGNLLLKLNAAENSVTVLATALHSYSRQFHPIAHPETGVIVVGANYAGSRDRFIIFDPKEGYIPKLRYIRNWIPSNYPIPLDTDDGWASSGSHFQVMYCKTDGYYYTRYTTGQIAKVNLTTLEAEVIYMTPSGVAFGAVFNPRRPSELWIAYSSQYGGTMANTICKLDVLDPIGTFEKVSNGLIGHRDGRIEQALFNDIRQLNFDQEGDLLFGEAGNHCIRKINLQTMMVETVIGIPGRAGYQNGSKDEALFRSPHGLIVDSDGIIYVADSENARIRRVAIE
jgi:sugar lactone lactonase YvrE